MEYVERIFMDEPNVGAAVTKDVYTIREEMIKLAEDGELKRSLAAIRTASKNVL